MAIEQEITKRVDAINSLLEDYLPKEEGFQKIIFEAMNYSLMAGGKRLRPMLMEETYHMLGGEMPVESKAIACFMASIEMIHTYSLVHDDLPAMDNDEYRRGKKTTHAVYGEAMGILAGDALLNYAFETATRAFEMEPDNPAIGRALAFLARKAGPYGMVGGQVVDVQSEKSADAPIDREKLDFIYRLKTGALMEAAMGVGAILAGASKEEEALVALIAEKVGLAFQIQDDILDETGTMEVLGKPIGSDAKNGKPTYVTFEGIDNAKKEVDRLMREAMEMLYALGRDDEFLEQLFAYLINREK